MKHRIKQMFKTLDVLIDNAAYEEGLIKGKTIKG